MAQIIENVLDPFSKQNHLPLENELKDVLKTLKEKGNSRQVLQNEENFFLFEVNHPIQENVINWYPFKAGDSILEIGGNAGAITGCLCQKAKKVVSIEFEKIFAEISYEKNGDYPALDILTGDPLSFVPEIPFDYIILNLTLFEKYYGSMMSYSLETLLLLAKKWKKDDGIILIICDNRLGIRYFNGASGFKGDLFSEIENHGHHIYSWNFSKNEIIENLKKSGLPEISFYYYFPDAQAPETIYSEENFQIREEGNFSNRLLNRLSFFDEKKVMQSLGNEKIAEYFCNSFFIECSDQPLHHSKRKKAAYCKISSLRKPCFRIGTLIYYDEKDHKKVLKYPLHPDASRHLKKMKKYEADHQKKDESGFLNVPIVEEGRNGELVFEFITGMSLEEQLIRFLEEGKNKEFCAALTKFSNMIYFGSEKRTDYDGEQFKEVFGPCELKEALSCKNQVNVDMIFSNIIVRDQTYTIIDYEWIFDFFIPVEFIVWRAVFYLYLGHEVVRKCYQMTELMEMVHVPSYLNEPFTLWDRFFGLEYVGDQNIQKYEKEPKNCRQLLQDEFLKNKNEKKELKTSISIIQEGEKKEQIVFEKRYQVDGNTCQVSFDLEGINHIRSIRWRPLNRSCRLNDVKVMINGSETVEAQAVNCAKTQWEWQYFITNDPAYDIPVSQPDLYRLDITANMIPLDTNEIVLEYNHLMKALEEVTNKKTMIQKIKEKSAKSIKKLKSVIRSDIIFHIDDVKEKQDEYKIVGWVFDQTSGRPVNEILLRDPEDTPYSVKYRRRNDVAAAYDLNSGYHLGYVMLIDKGKALKNIQIEIISEKNRRCVNIDLEKDYKSLQRQEMREHKVWIAENEKNLSKEAVEEIKKKLTFQPKISIVVPVYNVADIWLRAFMDSVCQQYYDNWELCIADDCSTEPHIRKTLEEYSAKDNRIKVYFRKENGHISKATNSALDIATGDFIGFMDNDDVLAQNALLEYVRLINEHPDAEFIYCDEDMIDENSIRFHPYFKSNWNEKMLLSHNYITHFVVVKRELVEKVGALDHQLNGSQDYDYVLRLSEQTRAIYHIPKLLYHWRAIDGSVADDPEAKNYAYEAGRIALNQSLIRRGIKAQAEIGENFGTYKLDYLQGRQPKVTVIWDSPRHSSNIERLLENTKYSQFELILINQHIKKPDCRVKALKIDAASMFERFNQAVSQAQYDYLVFLGDHIMPESENWLIELVNEGIVDSTAVAGGKKFDKKNRTLGSGISIDKDNKSYYYPQRGKTRMDMGDFYYLCLPRYVFAVDLDFTLIRKKDFCDVKGFSVGLNAMNTAVDFCLKIQKHSGKKIVWTPYATAVDSDHKNKTDLNFDEEIQKLWSQNDLTDPYRNKNTGIK